MALIELPPIAVAIFIGFLIAVLVFYKLFKVAVKLVIVTLAAFAFPWIVEYLNIPLSITPSIETGLQFALLGAVLFLVFTFFKAIIKLLKKLLGR